MRQGATIIISVLFPFSAVSCVLPQENYKKITTNLLTEDTKTDRYFATQNGGTYQIRH